MVSTGVRGQETWLADLTGLTYEAARQHARTAGLVVNRVVQQASDAPENTVLEQMPAPYVRVAVGSPVTLTVARARVSAPTQPTSSLPLPPPPAPPESAPDSGTLEPDAAAPDGTDTTPLGTPDPSAAPPESLPEQEQPLTPQEIPPTPQTGAETVPTAEADATSRSVSFRYTFPADLPPGSYTIVVRDADGEREIQPATDSTTFAGATVSSNGDVSVRGNAVFIIRQDGAEYATVTP
jgi:beta-lactam-binding protein with PASTA domain